MTVKIEGNELVIRIPVNTKPLPPSKSGKTLIAASSNGPVTTECVIDGKPLIVGLNAYVKKS